MQRIGSSKIITPVEPGVVAFTFTDKWSVYDRGSSPQIIPTIGASRCECAVRSFQLAHSANAATHFIEQVDEVTIHVKEFSVPGQKPLSGQSHGNVTPLEWLERIVALGSIIERINSGEIDPVSLGFPKGTVVEPGMLLPRPVHECTTKFEKVDRHLGDVEARKLAGLDEEQWEEVWDLVNDVANITTQAYALAGFRRADGKKEVALTFKGRPVMVDVFGTQDEDRIIDIKTGNLHCKDLIRNHLKLLPWKAELDAAKVEHPTNKSKWPPYPVLPGELVDLVSTRYAEAAERYAGVRIY